MPPTTSAIDLNGIRLTAAQDGSLFWPERGLLVVADLHLEKGSAFAATGQMLPPYDSRETLRLLETAVNRVQPHRVICLGDSFHDATAPIRMAPEDRARLASLAQKTDWIWIVGNHDPAPPSELGGQVFEDWTDGSLVFRHEARRLPVSGEVSGHFHPKAAVEMRARRLASRCFVEDGQRLILPAFGSYAGGLSVWGPAISGLFPGGFVVHLATARGVLRIPKARLLRAA